MFGAHIFISYYYYLDFLSLLLNFCLKSILSNISIDAPGCSNILFVCNILFYHLIFSLCAFFFNFLNYNIITSLIFSLSSLCASLPVKIVSWRQKIDEFYFLFQSDHLHLLIRNLSLFTFRVMTGSCICYFYYNCA